ncbi:Alpha/beta-hydrolase [Mycena venus]|uniref:Alpha/beta-hydrolase n=1 Tax=Mycena venus TaxID=2733690 RepID=A0A8H6YKU3_9AGAR|nr:Alpha/beta-hydrolase [Mycena venus]
MTEVLGYPTYAVHGTDWGVVVACSLYGSFNTTVRAAQLVLLLLFPLTAQEIAENNITLSDIQEVTEQRYIEWIANGNGYFIETDYQGSGSLSSSGFNSNFLGQPNDTGLALYDNPVGQLAWIGTKFKLYSDPRARTPPSNPNGFKTVYTKAPTDVLLLFSQYEYNVSLWPEE